MHNLLLTFLILFCVGCVAEPESSSFIEENLELNAGRVDNEEEVSYTVPQISVPDVLLEEDQEEILEIEIENTNNTFVFDACVCEWQTWMNDNGFMCLGIVCTDSCEEEIRACREVHQACVPRI